MNKHLKEFPILFKKDKKGRLMQWQIFAFKNMYYTVEGLVGGNLTTTKPTMVLNRTRGKTLEGTIEAKVKAILKKKKDSGYFEKGENPIEFFNPMLAFNIAKQEKKLYTVRTFVQPKLDGIRTANFNNQLQSRGGKYFISCPHLNRAESEVLDGELYNHNLKEDFNAIVSLVRRKKNLTQADYDLTKQFIQFHVYDMPGNEVFSERYKKLTQYFIDHNLGSKNFVLVPTYEITSDAELEKYHEQFLEAGYEGTIVRLDLGPYENYRSPQLLKKKDFIDEEFTIVGWKEGEGNRAGTIGEFKLVTKEGKEFASNVKGDFEYLTKIWDEIRFNPNKYLNTKATVKYFKRTPAGIPRFPLVIKLGREEYE